MWHHQLCGFDVMAVEPATRAGRAYTESYVLICFCQL